MKIGEQFQISGRPYSRNRALIRSNNSDSIVLMRPPSNDFATPTRPFSIVLTWMNLVLLSLSTQAAPRYVYLTWQGDTSTTITVNYQTMEEAESSAVYYDTSSHKGKIS